MANNPSFNPPDFESEKRKAEAARNKGSIADRYRHVGLTRANPRRNQR